MVQVYVSEGVLEGEEVQNEFGGKYYSFKGIPYAEPPVGDLRFKAPRPPQSWSGVRKATEFGSVCYQFDYYTQTLLPGSEDCLYLNVYSPDIKPKNPLPVMVYIHGGGFIWGSGNDDMYGPEFLVRQGVILVTINYRLEVLGFLSLDTEDVPGNAGMKDQVAALRWVKKNIANFGGDPNNVTIFGESAGGGSVSYHLISPMSKGLFKRAIFQSGVCLGWWAQAFEARRRAEAIAKTLGLNSKDDKELYEFFKSQPIESLIKIREPITYVETTKHYLDLNFSVVNEKKFGDNERFFYGNVDDAVKNNIHEGVEVMAGYVQDESLIIFCVGLDLNQMIDQANKLPEFFVPRPMALTLPVQQQLEIGDKIKNFYFKDENVSKINSERLLEFISADILTYPVLKMIKICANRDKNKCYFYKFTCKSERNIFQHILKLENIVGDKQVVCHCDDLAYLFPIKLWPKKVQKDSKEFEHIDRVTKLWTNFAKYGNPTPDDSLGVKWNPYTLEQQDYLDIGQELIPANAPDKEEQDFWDNLYKQYLQK